MNDAGPVQSDTYLTFHLDNDLFGLNIPLVREVLEYKTVTRVPLTADFMCGVINVRGRVVPVVDLRKKFRLEAVEKTINTCIIIVELENDGESSTMGMLVDGVQEVLEISREQIEAAPRMNQKIDKGFIRGIGKLTDDFVILLDIQEIFSRQEINTLSDLQQQEITVDA